MCLKVSIKIVFTPGLLSITTLADLVESARLIGSDFFPYNFPIFSVLLNANSHGFRSDFADTFYTLRYNLAVVVCNLCILMR